MTSTAPALPWYKQFWPWFLITFPATAVIAGIVTIILAVQSDDGLVKDDYYKAGLAINQTLERSHKARELNISAHISWDKLTQTMTVTLKSDIESLPAKLNMLLTHTTRSNHDQIIPLFLSPDKKTYTGRSKSIKYGSWIVAIEPLNSNWHISGRVTLEKQNQWIIKAK